MGGEGRCPRCRWVDVTGYSNASTQWLLSEPCIEHMDPLSSYYHREPHDDRRVPPASSWSARVKPKELTLADELARCWRDAMAEPDEIDRRNGVEP